MINKNQRTSTTLTPPLSSLNLSFILFLMKRTREEIIDLTGEPDPPAPVLPPPPSCAICRHALAGPCCECAVIPTHPDKPKTPCQGSVKNVLCEHSFHTECITRWIATRNLCPLCNSDWVYPWDLSLTELAALKAIGDEGKIIDIASMGDLNPRVCAILDNKLRTRPPPSKEKQVSKSRQRLLARTFAQYLTDEELNDLLMWKRAYAPYEKRQRAPEQPSPCNKK